MALWKPLTVHRTVLIFQYLNTAVILLRTLYGCIALDVCIALILLQTLNILSLTISG